MRCHLQVNIPCQCSHGGRVKFPDGDAGVILGGQHVVTGKMLLDATISGCPLPTKPCDKVVAVVSGPVTDYDVRGSRPLFADFVALTNGGPPGVVSATGREASCGTFAGGHGAPPQHPPSRSNGTPPMAKPLVVTVARELPAGVAHLVPDLPFGVTVTAVQPGKQLWWRSPFVWFEANGEGAAVFDLPADADTFVLVTSHPLVLAVHQLEPSAAPLPFAGGPGKGVTVERGGRFAGKVADVIAATSNGDGLTADIVPRLNMPWAKELPVEPLAGLVWRSPLRFAAGSTIRVKVATSFPKLLDLAHATTAAEAVAFDLVPAEWPSIRERVWLAALCETVADSPPVNANTLATLPPDGERVSMFLLRQHAERTAANAKRVVPLSGAMPQNPRTPDTGQALLVHGRRSIRPGEIYDGLVGQGSPSVVERTVTGNPVRSATIADVLDAASRGITTITLHLEEPVSLPVPLRSATVEVWPRTMSDAR